MTRPLRVGDRVTATGIVEESSPGLLVRFEGGISTTWLTDGEAERVTLIAPAEPPVGSVVVKDGVAYVHISGPGSCWRSTDATPIVDNWCNISDGDIIFDPRSTE
jgi:hypothetical protein